MKPQTSNLHRTALAISLLTFVTFALQGCSVFQHQPNSPVAHADEEIYTQPEREKMSATDSKRVNTYFDQLDGKGPARPLLVRLTVQQALAKYVPKDYSVTPDGDVDLHAQLVYDTNGPWLESLGKSLADIGVELNVSMYKRTLALKAYEASLTEVIEKYIPDDYKVYADSSVNLDTHVRYNMSLPWVEALGKSTAAVGIDATANLNKKVVVLKLANGTVTLPAAKPSNRIVTFRSIADTTPANN